ncbi:NAD-dependent succinate-semialdehyde dehydrogenase [Pseudomaricurvus alcaniphilus]|uniref:NAD-dependent succinate-semialdehyde dehydrogenase n=1 Tax=Pseudomaricurvus alcaniphilus TaxID=1166482 RepID=UPI00140DE6E3|nr:NAD-dependent succinate-semialdehyde dehydrogenase [Pseudomaricurvus alcaniphilus]NHN37866.1 NAD-dependent succinate-semialdehyde dehydrogenase [Pseudomaricurvus alcaniphilus]
MNESIPLQLQRADLLCRQNFIAGQWCDSAAGGQLAVSNPATDTVFAQVANSDQQDALAAVDAAQAALPRWRAQTARARSQLLKQWHRLILANSEDLATLMSLEQGKPLAEARAEVAYGASYVEWFAEEAVRARGDILPALAPGKLQMVVKEPIGVVAAITPWNFPLAMIARKLAPALAAGCTVIAKPAEDTPLTALALVKLAEEAGFPAGTINIVSASRESTATVVDCWLRDGRVRKITFTGSTPVGKHLARESADTLKKLSLELGGNAPFIVFADADLDAAVSGLMAAKFRNGGQTCVCPNRVYVHSDVMAAFTEKLQAQVEQLSVGPATHPAATIGPMINRRAIDKIQRHVDNAVAQGARLVAGGQPLRNAIADGPFYFAPTILADVTTAMEVCHEETFGPLVPLFRFHSESDVIEQANATPFGLAAYFYTQDPSRIWRVSSALQAGVIGINEGAVASEAAPFGGAKESGYGREGSHYGLDDYQNIKYLCQGNLG